MFKCDICSQQFSHKQTLQKHQMARLNPGGFQCHICLKTFDLKPYLKRHLHTHTTEKKFNCGVCRASFKRLDNCQKHMKIFHEMKEIQIENKVEEVSENVIATKQYDLVDVSVPIMDISEIYKGDRLHSCSKCEESFITNIELTRHERLHSGKSPYLCQFCGKSYKLKGHLNLHKKQHYVKDSFLCFDCGEMFSDQLDLEHHIIKFHT